MAQLLEDSLFCEEFIQQCPAAVEVLNLVAQECSAGEYQLLSLPAYLAEFCQYIYNLIIECEQFHTHSYTHTHESQTAELYVEHLSQSPFFSGPEM